MTFYANRKNIKIMFRFISQMMMILLRRFKTKIALERCDFRHFAGKYGIIYGLFGFVIMWIFFFTTGIYATEHFSSSLGTSIILDLGSSFLCLCISSQIGFVVFSSMIFWPTCFTAILIATFPVLSFIKFRNGFGLLAFTALFRYSFSSHFRLLNRRLWLEPVSGYVPVSGLFYRIA